MLILTEHPIDRASLRQRLDSTRLGGVVIFEGVVRDHHEGHPVQHLLYEAAASLTTPVFDTIIADATGRFGPATIVCAHRVGVVAPGEVAVWVGVATPHRAAAFEVCRYVIDTIKDSLPVWKKEIYTDGEGHWVNAP